MSKKKRAAGIPKVSLWAWVVRSQEFPQVALSEDGALLAFATPEAALASRQAAQAAADNLGFRVRLMAFRQAETLDTLRPAK